jgi:hypothetical protein
MSGSKIVDVVIGLSFVYLLLSLMCSALNELIASVASLRARTLKGGIKTLLADQQFAGLAKDIYAHPLINGLAHGARWMPGGDTQPSYIPSDTFAAALIDILQHDKAPAVAVPPDATGAAAALPPLGKMLLDRFAATDPVHKSLRALGIEQLDAGAIKVQIAKWFDDSMDRVGGYYKRYTQFIVAFLAVGVTLGLNANSITIGRALWTDQALRTSVAQAAGDQIKAGFKENNKGTIDNAAANLRTTTAAVENLNLPLGWDYKVAPPLSPFEQLLGLLGTMIAVSLGAPFWFETLNKLVNLRKAGEPPKTMDQKTREKEKPPVTK